MTKPNKLSQSVVDLRRLNDQRQPRERKKQVDDPDRGRRRTGPSWTTGWLGHRAPQRCQDVDKDLVVRGWGQEL
jgi:hypothetical protein